MSINFKFHSWFSSSDSIWKDWTYIYSENINTFNPEYIQTSPKTVNLINKDNIDFLIKSEFESDKFYYVKWNKIYDNKNNLIYEHWAWIPWAENFKINFAFNTIWKDFIIYAKWINNEKNWFESQNYFYSVFSWELYSWWKVPHYISIDDYVSFLYYSLSNRLYISWWWAYHIIDMTNYIKLESPSISWVHIKNSSSWFNIFSKKGYFSYWAWTNRTWIWDTYELDLSLLYVSSFSWIDYLFSEEWFFFLNWITASPIAYKTSSNYLWFKKFDFQKWIKFWNINNWKIIYTVTKTKKWVDLCWLWTEVVWAPFNFSSLLSKDWKKIKSMINYKTWILIHYEKKISWDGVDYFSFYSEEKNENGYLITKEYVADWQIFLKKALKLQFFADKLKEWEYLKISASINNLDFEEIRTLTNNDRWKNGFYEILNFNKEFHKIVFKLELKWSFKLYDFIFYDIKIK